MTYTRTSTRALGKKAGVVEDPRTFKVKPLLEVGVLPPIPMPWRIAVKLHAWEMHGNDNYGDCVFVTHAHRVAAEEWSSGRRDPIKVSTEDVLAFYSRVTGFDRNKPWTDNGAYLIDALRLLRTEGFGKEADGSTHGIYAYARVDDVGPNDEFKRAAHLFGGLSLGLALPVRAQNQDVWDTNSSMNTEEDELYSWGGHSVEMIGYDTRGITLVTWGAEQRATWAWVKRYCDEAWAVISEDFINRLGRTPQGLNIDRLNNLLATL